MALQEIKTNQQEVLKSLNKIIKDIESDEQVNLRGILNTVEQEIVKYDPNKYFFRTAVPAYTDLQSFCANNENLLEKNSTHAPNRRGALDKLYEICSKYSNK